MEAQHLLDDLHGFGLVGFDKGDGLEPGGHERGNRIRLLGDDLVGRKNDLHVEVLDQVAIAEEETLLALALLLKRRRQICGDRIDLADLEQRAGGRDVGARHVSDVLVRPVLALHQFASDPAGQGAGAGDGDLAAFKIGDILHRPAGLHRDDHLAWLPGQGRDRLHRRALDDQGHIGAAVEADVNRAGRHCLDQPWAAAEGRGFDGQAMLGENAGLHADLEQRVGKRGQRGLADAERLGGKNARTRKRKGTETG
jgi:hypothetical protein